MVLYKSSMLACCKQWRQRECELWVVCPKALEKICPHSQGSVRWLEKVLHRGRALPQKGASSHMCEARQRWGHSCARSVNRNSGGIAQLVMENLTSFSHQPIF